MEVNGEEETMKKCSEECIPYGGKRMTYKEEQVIVSISKVYSGYGMESIRIMKFMLR